MYNVNNIRQQFKQMLCDEQFTVDRTGVKMLEIIGSSFIADEASIFGTPNQDYIKREITWYNSMSLSVHDLEDTPTIWKEICDDDGFINSNYGWMILSSKNGNQYENVFNELHKNPSSRRAEMIYTRPSMHTDYYANGMSDFCCTLGVDYFIRDNKLNAVVKMRSNDVVFGFKNDYAWQKYVLESLGEDLGCSVGDIIWQASSLHVYEKHFKLLMAPQQGEQLTFKF